MTAAPQRLVGQLRLRQLALVAALDAHRSLRRAAEAIAVTQPAATRMLRDLEGALGVQLFERHAWGMEPTAYGEAFVRHARAMLTEAEEAHAEIGLMRAGARGVLRVGCVTGGVPGWLVPAARATRAQRPGLRLFLLVNTSDVLAAALLAGTLDVAIGRLPADADARAFVTRPLGDEPLWIVARRGHPLAARRTAGAADLATVTWILQPPGSPLRQEANAVLEGIGVRAPLELIETASIVATLALLRDTDALSVMPAGLATHYGQPGWLARVAVAGKPVRSRYELILRRERALSPAAAAFVEEIGRAARGHRSGRDAPGPG